MLDVGDTEIAKSGEGGGSSDDCTDDPPPQEDSRRMAGMHPAVRRNNGITCRSRELRRDPQASLGFIGHRLGWA